MKRIIQICPHCEEANLRTKDKGLSTEYKYCLGCKVELFLYEVKEVVEIVHSWVDETGKRIFYKNNPDSSEKRKKSLRKALMAKRVKNISSRDRNLLRRLRK